MITAAVAGAGVCVAAGPYLAGLARTVPDDGCAAWWRPVRVPRRQLAGTVAVAAVLGALAGAATGWSAALPAFLALALLGTPLTVIDLAHHRLPNRLVHPLAVCSALLLALAAALTGRWADLLRAGEGAVVVYLVLYAMHGLSPASFGRGDVRLGGVLGGYLGWVGWGQVGYGIVAGFALGGVVAVALLTTRRITLKTAMPFGPLLLLGALLVLAFDLVPATA